MRIFLFLLFCLCAVPAWSAETAYFSALSDLPVAPGLVEETGSAVRFDQPEGRIIVLQATGSTDSAAIQAFYAKTLPALGWKATAPGRYARGKEALVLEVKPGESTSESGQNRLAVLLRPL